MRSWRSRYLKEVHKIENTCLIDLRFSMSKYTWIRGCNDRTTKSTRLGCILCNLEWHNRFQNGDVLHLLRSHSDHLPLLIGTGGFNPPETGNKLFRKQWTKDAPITVALSYLTDNLIRWNKEVLGNLFRRKRTLWARIEGIQYQAIEVRYYHLLKLERKLRREINEVPRQTETYWFQKSKMDAIKDEDRNTRHFHTATIIRRRYNRLYIEEDTSATVNQLPSSQFPSIGEKEFIALNKSYTREEIIATPKKMGPLKALGPDGYKPSFPSNIGISWARKP
ncbi:hypothetical protein Cgig2_030069 [Carnegiea gigantea]|uniref:Reverse transcriptase n=1 Tax=Carnegiea gigantea TaxID=171969 RepID=A0A9Q1GSW2_9CARY|nr:hypothetical protein Cgig2_030069 [Carnegiea gigantea]